MALLKKLKGPFEKELLIGSDDGFFFYKNVIGEEHEC
jgi:hypothetical protein